MSVGIMQLVQKLVISGFQVLMGFWQPGQPRGFKTNKNDILCDLKKHIT